MVSGDVNRHGRMVLGLIFSNKSPKITDKKPLLLFVVENCQIYNLLQMSPLESRDS